MIGILVSKEKSISLEKNCRIEKNNNGYEVYSDSEKFGNNQLMYSNKSFVRCVEYITLVSDEKFFIFNDNKYIIL